jgi:peptide deformylase
VIQKILLLGDERLYKVCQEISADERSKAEQIVNDLHDTLINFRNQNGFGRAIAAPQINAPYRIIYMNYGDQSIAFLNPRIEFPNLDKFTLWDDCMSFPGLEVKVERYRKCRVYYKDLDWNDRCFEPNGDLSELFQHEYDHLDGVLAIQKALDSRSFRMNSKKAGCFASE